MPPIYFSHKLNKLKKLLRLCVAVLDDHVGLERAPGVGEGEGTGGINRKTPKDEDPDAHLSPISSTKRSQLKERIRYVRLRLTYFLSSLLGLVANMIRRLATLAITFGPDICSPWHLTRGKARFD